MLSLRRCSSLFSCMLTACNTTGSSDPLSPVGGGTGPFLMQALAVINDPNVGKTSKGPPPKERANRRKRVTTSGDCQSQTSTIRRQPYEFPVNAAFFNIRLGDLGKV